MKKTLLALALASLASSAAADSLLYGGASVGQSSLGSETSTSTSIHVGTGVLPFLGLEAGYTDHGSFDVSSGVEKDVSSVFVAVRPSLDLGPLHIYARGGLHEWDSTETGGIKDDGTDIMYGIGAELTGFGPIKFGGSYEVYEIDGADDVEEVTLIASFHFM